jgi:hypothetical protein
MMFKYRLKLKLLRIFLPFFLVSSLIIPRPTYAIVPLIPFVFSAVSTTGLTFSAADLTGLAIALAGSVAIAYMSLTAPDGSQIRVPMQDASIHPSVVVPAPSAPATSTPIPSYTYNTGSAGGIYGTGSSAQAACQNIVAQNPVGFTLCSYSETQCIIGQTAYGSNTCSIGNITPAVSKNQTGTICPAGYTVSGSNCNLSNARAVTQDKAQDFTRNGAAYAPVSGDLVGTIVGIQGTTTGANDTLTFIGGQNAANDPYFPNLPAQAVFQALSNGGTSITYSYQAADSSGTSYVKSETINTASDGTVSSSSGTSTSGSLNTAAPASNGSLPTVANPSGSIAANPSSTQPQSITFPSDYARTGEAAAAAVPVVNDLTQIHTDLTATQAAPADPALPQSGDFQSAFFNGTFSNLLSWAPNLSGSCPTHDFSFTFYGQTFAFTLNSHCQLLEDNRSTMSAIMVAAWTVAALFLVLGA